MISEFQGPYRFLSNFWPAEVYLCDILDDGESHLSVYPTVEHAYQAAKTKDRNLRKSIQRCKSPADAKRLARTFALRSDWHLVKVAIMSDLVLQKFGLHDDLREMLLATGDEELQEGNTWGDTFWGVCRGKGENHLGKILMNVRAKLRD